MESLLDKLGDWRLKRFEKQMKELKPQLLSKWHDSLEEQIRAEYEEELEKLSDQVYELNRDIKELRNSRDYYKGKYEGVVEMQDKVQDKLINKIEQSGTAKGQLKQEVKQLKEEVATTKEEIKEATDSIDSEG